MKRVQRSGEIRAGELRPIAGARSEFGSLSVPAADPSANRLAKIGVDLWIIQELGRWAAPSMVQGYASLGKAYKAEAMGKFSENSPAIFTTPLIATANNGSDPPIPLRCCTLPGGGYRRSPL